MNKTTRVEEAYGGVQEQLSEHLAAFGCGVQMVLIEWM